ncbi:hypothetical protein AB3S75_015741 [Citrus x aurantiifolia]
MSVEEYCLKVKILADKLACAGSPMSDMDLLMQVLNGLGTSYLDLMSIITANKMSYDDAHALLLSHEARSEQSQNSHNTKVMFNANYGMMNSNYAQVRGNNRIEGFGYRGYRRQIHHGNINAGRGMTFNTYPKGFNTNSHNFGRGNSMPMQFHKALPHPNPHSQGFISTGTESDDNIPVCQRCHKLGHTADACWHRYIENYMPQSRQFGRGRGPKSAYMATFEPHTESAPYFDDFYDMNRSNYQSYNLDPVTYSSMPHCSYEMSSATGAACLDNFEGLVDEG